MKTFEIQYKDLIKKILNYGIEKNDRTGTGTLSLFSEQIKIDISEKFPILTGKKIFEKTFKTEFEWFINGETNIKRFKDNNVNIWDNWADKDGNLGPVYGYQMKNFNGSGIDQLNNVINSIITDKNGRRHIITLWNPQQTDEMALPPCYLYFQFYVNNNELNMHVVQRSGDVFIGVPYDICLFSMLLMYVAEKTGLKQKYISYNIVDAHIYKNHIDICNIYLKNKLFRHPKYEFKNNKLTLKNYKSKEFLKAKISI